MSFQVVGLHHQEIATVNVLLAAIALMNGEPAEGELSASEAFRPGSTSTTRAAYLAAAFMQTEVSLPIAFSDGLVREVAEGLEVRVVNLEGDAELEELIVKTDAHIHSLIARLGGKCPLIMALADRLVAQGTLPVSEVALALSAA